MTRSRYPDDVRSEPWRLSDDEVDASVYCDDLHDPKQCLQTLHFGFFFDGTRNNMLYDESKQAHSNVARLYRRYDEAVRSTEGKRYRFATYVPGVGTEFWRYIPDAGVGLHASAGAAAGWGGEARINWALLQLQNNLHWHWFGYPLTGREADRALVEQMSTDIRLRRMREAYAPASKPPAPQTPADTQSREAVGTTQALQAVISTQWRGSDTDGRRRVLAERRARLKDLLTPLLTQRLPRIAKIRISVFGFSRGAAEARVFVNWLRDLCDNATGPMKICGVPAIVDFLGIFDTVASVGAAQSFLADVASGHGGWASPRDLRIPDASVVARCVHMVSGHEVRGSFPVDAASGENVEEIVYPGVHSDIGGGYRPGEQGRGMSDSAKLSQIPLCDMYRAARVAGVPLMSAAGNPDFAVDAGLIARFNAYMGEVRDTAERDTNGRVQAHYRHFLRWRRYRLGAQADLPCVARSPRQDRADLLSADDELRAEWELMQRGDGYNHVRNGIWLGSGYTGMLADLIEGCLGLGAGVVVGGVGTVLGVPGRIVFHDLPGGVVALIAPVKNGTDAIYLGQALVAAAKGKWVQWKQVENAWKDTSTPSAAVRALFENDVHDSRAWFKPFGKDDDVWEKVQRERLKSLLERERQGIVASPPKPQARPSLRDFVLGVTPAGAPSVAFPQAAGKPPLTREEREELARYRERVARRGRKEGDLSPELLPTQDEGREFHELWGYLRWRTVYSDRYMDHRSRFPTLAGKSRGELKSRKSELEGTIRSASAKAQMLHRSYSPTSMPSAEGAREIYAAYSAISDAEVELEAVEAFLAEMGPELWW